MNLVALQHLFTEAALGRATDAQQAVLEGHLLGSPVLSAGEGIEAYRDSVEGKLLRSLEQIYPVCHKLVGSQFFKAMGSAFLATAVSRSPDLGDFGADLPDYLSEFPAARSLPYLPDVARLEWLWHRAFNAPDQPGLDLGALALVPPEHWNQIVFRLPAGAALIASDYPIHRIWESNTLSSPGQEEMEFIDLDQGGIRIFVWRDGHDTRLDLPDEQEWLMLEAVARGLPFGELCTQTPQLNAATIAELLPIWVQRGWLREFALADGRLDR